MTEITITEALAELKTLQKRILKKREFIMSHLLRQEKMKDPLESDGGSYNILIQERQAVDDLEKRFVGIRTAIAQANSNVMIEAAGQVRSVAEWLVWRRDIAPLAQNFLTQIAGAIKNVREQAQQKGLAVTAATELPRPDDVVVNISEIELAASIEKLEETLGVLDGQLSLKNATVVITI